MRSTIIIDARKTSETTLKVTALFGNGTSDSRSLEPMIYKAFQRVSKAYFGGGSWHREVPIDTKIDEDSNTYIRTSVYTKL